MPAIENLVNKTEWSSLTGLILDGGYEMKEPLELEDASALFKIRILGGWGQEAMVRLYHADLAQAEEQLSFWQTLREWPHPNVTTPLAAGYRWLGEVGVVYVILPIPDEKLSGVLKERPLAVDEASEVIRNIASALGHLHACGLAHGGISPEAVFAIGDSIQVSIESVRRQGAELLISPPRAHYLAPESETANNTPAADIWCLGATLFEVLTQQRYTSGAKEQIRLLPFSLLLNKCLEENPDFRCNLVEALEIFERGPKAAPPGPKPVIPEPPVPEAMVEAPAAVAEFPLDPVVQEAASSVQAPILETPVPVQPDQKASEPIQPASAAREETKPYSTSSTTGAAARVAAAEEARKAAAAGEAFKKTRSSSPGTNSILSAPLPSESRHKPAEMKRKPVAAKIRQLGASETASTAPKFTMTGSSGGELARRTENKPWSKPKPRTWQLAVAGSAIFIMLIAVIFLVVLPRLQSPMEPAGPTQNAAASPTSKGSAWQTKTLAPPVDANAHRPAVSATRDNATPAEIASGQANNGANNWRLVLYAYRYRQDAERRLILLKRSHPTVDARLFIPVRKWPFMVVMGGPMSKDAADDLKKQAIAEGLPRAIYVQRF